MIPSFIKRLIGASLVVALVVLVFLFTVDWRVALSFGLSALWMMGNLLLWTAIAVVLPHAVALRRLKLLLLVMLKLAFLALGVVALNLAAPLNRAQMLAVLAGICLVFVVAVVKAGGAWLSGTDLLTGKRLKSGESRQEEKKEE